MNGALRNVKLLDIAQLNPGLGESPGRDDLVSFVPMSAVTAESASTTRGEDRNYGEVSKGYTPFLDGDVLLAKITPCFENGKIAQARLSRRIGVGSTEFHVVRPIDGKSDARYLLHFLRQERIRRDGERRMTGSAGQRRVPEHFLAGLEVPAPPLAEQRRIAEVLDRAEALRAKRRAAPRSPNSTPSPKPSSSTSSATQSPMKKIGPSLSFKISRASNEVSSLLGPETIQAFTVGNFPSSRQAT
jgi:type I restriction enzyme S subunit